MFAKSTPDRATFVWNPLTRDGGAKLHRAYPLYSVTTVRNPSTLRIEPPSGP
ncbi:YjbH domain-containing protein [Polaromonas sp.]|uniref:YjbH domain-containing protein n=1 Tax=Polaromonas sp. TaxID=1869339 RepID=UPI00386213A2